MFNKNNMQIKKLGSWLCIGLLPALILVSCTGNNKSELEQEAEKIDSNKSNIVSVGGTMFSIPSPIQTSMLLKKSGAPYSKAILNVPANVSKYSTAVKKALNLGIYGADLGYVILYQQTPNVKQVAVIVQDKRRLFPIDSQIQIYCRRGSLPPLYADLDIPFLFSVVIIISIIMNKRTGLD